MPQYDFRWPETKSPKDWKTTDGGATPVHVVDRPKPWKGDRQSAARILSPLRGSVLSIPFAQGLHPCLCYVVPVGDFLPLWLSAAWRATTQPAQRDALGFWDTLSTGQQTASTHPHPGRDTKNKPASQRTPWEAGWSGLFRIWNSGCYCTIFQITLVLRPVPFNRNSFTDCLHVIVVVPYWFKL